MMSLQMTKTEKTQANLNHNENVHCYHKLLQDLYELANCEEKMKLEISFLEDENEFIGSELAVVKSCITKLLEDKRELSKRYEELKKHSLSEQHNLYEAINYLVNEIKHIQDDNRRLKTDLSCNNDTTSQKRLLNRLAKTKFVQELKYQNKCHLKQMKRLCFKCIFQEHLLQTRDKKLASCQSPSLLRKHFFNK